MKTISLPLSKKLAALNLGVESELYWVEFKTFPVKPWQILTKEELENINHPELAIPSYSLQELLPLLKALGEKKGWIEDATCPDFIEEKLPEELRGGTLELLGPDLKTPLWRCHFLRIAELFSQSESLEGEVEEYITNLL